MAETFGAGPLSVGPLSLQGASPDMLRSLVVQPGGGKINSLREYIDFRRVGLCAEWDDWMISQVSDRP